MTEQLQLLTQTQFPTTHESSWEHLRLTIAKALIVAWLPLARPFVPSGAPVSHGFRSFGF